MRTHLHRTGVQPLVPAVGTNRRVTVVGSVDVFGRGRVEVVGAGQASACFRQYLEALDQRQDATQREISLILDNGPAQRSKKSQAELAQRAEWLQVVWLSRYTPELNRNEREWRYLKRGIRSHLARTLRTFVDEVVAEPRRLGGERCDSVDRVPQWFLAGHRRLPTGRKPGRPKGAKDARPRAPKRQKLAAAT